MKVDLEFVELHTPLFIEGMNFGTKLYLDPKKSKAPIQMWYDTTEKLIFVVYNSKLAFFENWANATCKDPKQFGVELTNPKATVVNVADKTGLVIHQRAQVTGPEKTIRTAQVATPMDKVQGAPSKKAKYQGEESQGE